MVVGEHSIRVQHLLAEGGFSQVFLVKDGVSGKAMALKRVLCQSDEAEKDATWEIKVHKVLCEMCGFSLPERFAPSLTCLFAV
jgi:hypothetical protein